jgi:hypothetical protein
MKATLTFNLPEEQEEFQNAVDGTKNKYIIDEIYQHVFRPAFKHGYNSRYGKLQELSDRDIEVIEILADIYREVIREDI